MFHDFSEIALIYSDRGHVLQRKNNSENKTQLKKNLITFLLDCTTVKSTTINVGIRKPYRVQFNTVNKKRKSRQMKRAVADVALYSLLSARPRSMILAQSTSRVSLNGLHAGIASRGHLIGVVFSFFFFNFETH